VLARFPDFAALLEAGEEEAAMRRLRRAETIGRPIGGEDFVTTLEALSARRLAPAKRGPKPKKSALSP
jgi:REP-associated tyrosine transposase